ncbi:MAG TPA: PDZ domain-containing protein [Acidobacteriaceae bacterium]|nr:PDZ domain-containing protein [Acidobacteriaceae bacterium]
MNLPSVAAVAVCFALVPSLQAQSTPAPDTPFNPLVGAAQHLVLPGSDALLTHSQAYLGVSTRDVDTELATQLKLKEARGAEIVTIDHDAPAAKAGLHIHDVLLSLNNQAIDGQAQLSRMLREIPAGRTVTFLLSRDGQIVTLQVQLADRSTIEADAWSQHIPVPDPDEFPEQSVAAPLYGNSFIAGIGRNPLYTGLELDMLGPQLANYFGVHDGQGLLIKRVDDNSPAFVAGLRAGDIITKMNGQTMATTSQWFKAIHANRGKQVQLTVVRDRKENTVPLMAGRPKSKG